jgi:WD40-like Beta Propeller Repeat
MKKINPLIYLVIFILLTACSSKPPIKSGMQQLEASKTQISNHTITPKDGRIPSTFTPSTIFTPIPTRTSTPVPTLTPTLTHTQIPVSMTPTKILVPTIPPDIYNNQCLEVVNDLPIDAVVNGNIILANYNDHSAYLIDILTGEEKSLSQKSNEENMYFTISPNRKWVAYKMVTFDSSRTTIGSKQMVIAASDGRPQKTLPWENEWFSTFDWLDDTHLVIPHMPEQGIDTSPLIVLDPFSGRRQELLLNFPGIYADKISWGVYSLNKGVYDPTLTRVVYPQTQADLPAILRDVKANKDLAYVPYGGYHEPKWSSDGKRVAIAAVIDKKPWFEAQEFFTVDWNGEVTQVTHLSNYLGASKIYTFNWSPDNRYVAFWLNTVPNASPNTSHLAVLDTNTGGVMDYCITGAPVPEHDIERNDTAPIWSPDGTQLLIEAQDANDQTRYFVILVDIVHGWAARIAENLTPVGWMISP